MNRYFNYFKKIVSRYINRIIRAFYLLALTHRKAINIISRIIIKIIPENLVYNFEWLINKKSPTNRRYLRRNLTIEKFFDELNNKNINYVVLRWFEVLPNIDPGEDIDILISDGDVPKLNSLLTYVPYTQSCDIYSVTGLSGTAYKDIPYYPPLLAEEILEKRVLVNSKFYVPDYKRHFFSLAYHAVFHKGSASGLKHRSFEDIENSDHDYVNALLNIPGADSYITETIDYINLFQILKNNNWVPEIDTFRILAKYDAWVQNIVSREQLDIVKTKGDLIVFIVREWAIKNHFLETVQNLLKDRHKLEILYSKILTESEKSYAKYHVRGGKWHRGPYPSDGGVPACIIICFDYTPKWGRDGAYPHVKNLNVLAKHGIRNLVNEKVMYLNSANFIHSSDDYSEAVNYIKKVIPNALVSIKEKMKEREYFFSTDFDVIETFPSNYTRSKTEKIKYNNKVCAKKTFKLGSERFLKREVMVTRDLKENICSVPEYVSSGDNYIITAYYENVLINFSSDEAIQKIRSKGQNIVDVMKDFYKNGYAIIGFYPGNIIITPEDELMVIDFEFLHQYKVKPKTFAESYDIVGVPDKFEYDCPKGVNHTYKNTWQTILGPIEQYL